MTLWRSKLDGNEKMQLTFPPVRAYGPRWSPDDAQIVYTDLQYDPTWKIGLVSRAGGSSQVLLQDDINLGDPNWMPDGKSIVFAKFDRMGKGALHQLDLKTKEVSSISDSEGLFSRILPGTKPFILRITVTGR
jgi:Tol biopolymer transport system component